MVSAKSVTDLKAVPDSVASPRKNVALKSGSERDTVISKTYSSALAGAAIADRRAFPLWKASPPSCLSPRLDSSSKDTYLG